MSTATDAKAFPIEGASPMVLHFQPVINLSDDQLYEFARTNRDWQIERNQQGEITVMPPAGSEASDRNAELTMQLRMWAKRDGKGTTFDSSGGFVLPNGAMRSPDAAWVPYAKLEKLTAEQRKKFPPLCPDFVAELRSESDRLSDLHSKMREYIANGTRLGLLIDPVERRIHFYRDDGSVETQDAPATVSCEPVLPGCVIELKEIW